MVISVYLFNESYAVPLVKWDSNNSHLNKQLKIYEDKHLYEFEINLSILALSKEMQGYTHPCIHNLL